MDELIKPAEPEQKTGAQTKKNKIIRVILYSGAIVILSGIWLGYKYFYTADNIESFTANTEKISSQQEMQVPRRLDGAMVSAERKNDLPVAVVIENFPDARPQSGLSRASLVYEAEAEGRITRFLAVFDSGTEIEKIGPIRSARPYFIDWADELGALFVHCGGSPEALVKIKQEKIFDLNEFYNGGYFWRDTVRKPPHNIYTSMEKLNSFLEKVQYDSPDYQSWKYQEEKPEEQRPENGRIDIIYSQPHFVVQWDYDKINNSYLRFQEGAPHLDAEGKQIIAKNVAIAYMPNQVIDKDLRIKLENSGKGEAAICYNGVCEKGGWSKSPGERLTFQGQTGSEISFNRGVTWVEIVSPDQKISY